jgi:hypothetical protein
MGRLFKGSPQGYARPLCSNDVMNCPDNVIEFEACKSRMNWQRNDAFRQLGGNGKIPIPCVTAEDRLAMDRQGIMHSGLDATAQQGTLKLVPGDPQYLGFQGDRVQAKCVAPTRWSPRSLDTRQPFETLG